MTIGSAAAWLMVIAMSTSMSTPNGPDTPAAPGTPTASTPPPTQTTSGQPPPVPAAEPQYAVVRTEAAHDALLAAAPEAWEPAALIEWGEAPYATGFRALSTPRGLYLRFDAHDVKPWHTMTQRDDKIWNEEVVEIFIDPGRQGHHYAELEINPINIVCDLRMLSGWPDVKGEIDWHFAGLASRVTPMPGEPDDWIATAFLPWEDFRSLPTPDGVALPPRAGDRWRFNVFRIKRPNGPERPEDGAIYAAWSKPPGRSFHVPAVFREMIFR